MLLQVQQYSQKVLSLPLKKEAMFLKQLNVEMLKMSYEQLTSQEELLHVWPHSKMLYY